MSCSSVRARRFGAPLVLAGVLGALSGVGGSCPAAWAAAPAAADAEAAFRRGSLLVDEGNLEGALVEFRRSLSLYPTRAATRNVAVALRKLGRYDEAAEALKDLAAHWPPPGRTQRDALAAEIAALQALVGELSVECTVSDARVLVDGRPRGRTPLPGALSVATGGHVLRVERSGYVPFERRIEVAAQSRTEVRAELDALVAPPRSTPAPGSPPRAQRHPAQTARGPLVGLGVVGLGVVAGTLGFTFLGLRAQIIGDMHDARCAGALAPAPYEHCDELARAARARGSAALVSLVTGGVLLAGGAALTLALRPWSSKPSAHATCRLGPGVVCSLVF